MMTAYASTVLLCSCDDAMYVSDVTVCITDHEGIDEPTTRQNTYMCLKPLQVITFGYRQI